MKRGMGRLAKYGAWRMGDLDAPSKLAVAICTLGQLAIEYLPPFNISGMPLGQAKLNVFVVGFGIQDARNIAWARAYDDDAGPYEYFMFWDDDVVPLGPAYVERMLETMEQNPEIDILGGVYPARQGIPSPIVLKEKNGSPWWGWEDGGIHRVWMTGTGFTMYRVSSIEKLKREPVILTTPGGYVLNKPNGEPWPIREYFNLVNGTDDYALAKDAEEAGLTWYVHGGVVCDQIELNGYVHAVRDARQRIGGNDDKDTHPKGNDDSGAASVGTVQGNGPANVRNRRRSGSVSPAGATPCG